MDGAESRIGRLAAWGGLTVLTCALVGVVSVERAAEPPATSSAVMEEVRQRFLRDVDQQIRDALARGDVDEVQRLVVIRRNVGGPLAVRRLGAG